MIAGDGGRAVAIACDVSDVSGLPAAVDAVHDALGPVDVLVNNAGAFVMSPLGGSDEAGFDLMIGANLKGPFFLTQAILPDFEAAGRGKVINIGSIFGNDGPRLHRDTPQRGLPGAQRRLPTSGGRAVRRPRRLDAGRRADRRRPVPGLGGRRLGDRRDALRRPGLVRL